MSSTRQRTGAQTRERLIESHLPLVKAVAKRYAGPNAELEDLVQVGAVGLIKASDRFDPDRGVAFATFATPTIEGEIRHHLRDRGSAMRIPRRLQRLGRKVNHCQGELAVKLGRSPTAAEVAAALNISEDDVDLALAAEQARDSVPLAAEGDAAGAVPELSSGSDNRLTLASTMRALDDRERRIVYLRFHADKTERQIAKEMGISQAHVSRLLSGALTKLRDGLQTAGDTTPEPVISADSTAPTELDRPQKLEKRQTGAAPTAGRRQRVEDGELRSAIERWLASERGAEPPAETATGDAAKASGPERRAGSTHSGRFLVRMPSTLHEQLAQAAEREQVSLNRYVTDALATTVSPEPEPDPEPELDHEATPADAVADPTPPSARTIRMVLAANLAIVILSVAVAVVLLVLALQQGV